MLLQGANPMSLKKGIEAGVVSAVESIKGQSQDVSSNKEQIANVAAISAADTEIGGKISEAIDKVGKDGVITVEESQTFGMDLDFVEGMRFDKGYISPILLLTQNVWKQYWKTRTFSLSVLRFLQFEISSLFLKKLCNLENHS